MTVALAILLAGSSAMAQDRTPTRPSGGTATPRPRPATPAPVPPTPTPTPTPPTSAEGDPTAEKSAEKPPVPQRLFMVVRTDAFQAQVELDDKISTGIRQTPTVSTSGFKITPISRSAYEALASLITRGPVTSKLEGGDVTLEPFTGESSIWELSTGSPDRRLVDLEIVYDQGNGTDAKEKYEVAPKTQLDAPLRYYKPGLYLLKTKEGLTPKSSTLTIKAAGDKPEVITMAWPQVDRYYVIALSDFVGDPNMLFETLRDKAKISSPFKAIGKVEPTTLVLADLKEEPPSVDAWNDLTTFKVRFPVPFNTEPKRVWMLFPVSPKQREEELRKFSDLVRTKSFKSVPDYVRQRAVMADQPALLSPDSPPRWYEVERSKVDPANFERELKLDKVDQWKAQKEVPEAWRVVIYEFGEGEDARPIALTHPLTHNRQYAIDQVVDAWPIGIRNLQREAGDKP